MIPQGHQTAEETYERRDVDALGVFLLIALLLLLLTISFFGVWGLMHYLHVQRHRSPLLLTARSAKVFPQPRLQAVPGVDWVKDEAAQQDQLFSYGWVDRAHGVAHIPIDRAMELLLQRGLPNVGAGQTRLQLMQARPTDNLQPNQPVTAPAPSATP